MARYYVNLPDWESDLETQGGVTDANADARALAFRDAFRDALDPDDLATNWLVSDIAKWANGSAQGYGFTIFHRSGGSNTGPAWTWFLPGEFSSTPSEIDDFLQSSQMSNYFRTDEGSTSFNFDGVPGLHYSNLGGTTDPYDFGYNLSNGTLTGGDFSAPATNPASDLVTFMPSTPLWGVVFNGGLDEARSKILCVADDVKPFLAFYHTNGLDLYPRGLSVLGDIIVPYRASDTETQGRLSYLTSMSATTQCDISDDYLLVQADDGSRLSMNAFFNNIFTIRTVPFDDGTYPWDVIALQASSYFKGWIDSDVVRVMGPDNRDLYSLYNGGNFIKYTRNFCFPYVPNEVVWPVSPGS